MLNDTDLLATIPDFVSFGMLMKATPREEGGKRIIYVEASKESKDQEGEIVLAKALKDSADIFRKFGVLDLDHLSMPSVAAKNGIMDPENWVIGQPLDVAFNGDVTFVKAQLRRGESKLAERANKVWDGLTKVDPPDRYYASVGGSVTGRAIRLDPLTKSKVPVITGTHWNNLALSLNPVHPDLGPASTSPIGVFTKSLGGWVMRKALEASYATDATALTGGGAFGQQSLDTGNQTGNQNYFDFRNKLADAMREGAAGTNPGVRDLVAFCNKTFGLSLSDAAEYVERFCRDLKIGLNKRSKP